MSEQTALSIPLTPRDDVALRNAIALWADATTAPLVDLPLSRFNVYTITNTDAQSGIEAGKGIILIEINDSEQVPHQTRDKGTTRCCRA